MLSILRAAFYKCLAIRKARKVEERSETKFHPGWASRLSKKLSELEALVPQWRDGFSDVTK